MALESARDISGIRHKMKKLTNSGDCEHVKDLPESSTMAGFSLCEVRILHLYMSFSKKLLVTQTEITKFLTENKKYDERRNNCFRENLNILFNHYRMVYPILGDFNQMKEFSQTLSSEYKI